MFMVSMITIEFKFIYNFKAPLDSEHVNTWHMKNTIHSLIPFFKYASLKYVSLFVGFLIFNNVNEADFNVNSLRIITEVKVNMQYAKVLL